MSTGTDRAVAASAASVEDCRSSRDSAPASAPQIGAPADHPLINGDCARPPVPASNHRRTTSFINSGCSSFNNRVNVYQTVM